MGFPKCGGFVGIFAAVAFSSSARADGPPLELAVESGQVAMVALPGGTPSRVTPGPATPSCLIGDGQVGQLDFQISVATPGQAGAARGRCSAQSWQPASRTRYKAVPLAPASIAGTANLCPADGRTTVAADGTLYFGSLRPGGRGASDLYRARPGAAGHAEPENLGIAVNSAARDVDGYISPDQTVLVFASDRPGGHGKLDLYVSHRIVGGWSPARNLGPAVNGPDDESCPQITPDGHLLIFHSSQGVFQVDAAILDDATP